MYAGLLANTLGCTEGKLKSMFIELSLFCGCEESSRTFRTAGSKGIIEPKLKSNGGGTGDWTVEVGLLEPAWKCIGGFEVGVGVLYDDGCTSPFFGIEKVNWACLRAMFSLCNRDNRSRRFSFSDSACWFLASRAATLSSS